MANHSQIRQNYHEECEALVNKQVNMELYASYVYTSMVREEKDVEEEEEEDGTRERGGGYYCNPCSSHTSPGTIWLCLDLLTSSQRLLLRSGIMG